MLEILTLTCLGLIIYHHAVYPFLLSRLASIKRAREPRRPGGGSAPLPFVTLIVPAHNEAAVISEKVANLAALDYPADRLRIVLALDGCTDATRAKLDEALLRAPKAHTFVVEEYKTNIGKVPVLNDQVARVPGDHIVALSDASAVFAPGSLRVAVKHFRCADIGVVCPTYRLRNPGSEGERAYWQYQTRVKRDEATLAAPMGAHGAFYLFRRSLWTPLPIDTINDDFELPVGIVAQGHRAVYEQLVVGEEIERIMPYREFARRIRIGAGNVQQIVRFARLANPRRPALAFVFISGKGLRPAIAPLFLVALAASGSLALAGRTTYAVILGLLLALIGAGVLHVLLRRYHWTAALAWAGYLLEGHAASFIGAARFVAGYDRQPWKRVSAGVTAALRANKE